MKYVWAMESDCCSEERVQLEAQCKWMSVMTDTKVNHALETQRMSKSKNTKT